MQPMPHHIRDIDRAKIDRARQMTMEERFLAGLRLWPLAKETVRAGVRMQFPGASEEEVERITRQRMGNNHAQ